MSGLHTWRARMNKVCRFILLARTDQHTSSTHRILAALAVVGPAVAIHGAVDGGTFILFGFAAMVVPFPAAVLALS